ncbi:MAG: hypothetical protein ACYTEZ_11855 [Planctomycetota bacterium]|jgi:hypothetical protein
MDLERLARLLVDAESTVAVEFNDSEMWELRRLCVAQDDGEDSPHADAEIVRLIRVPEEKHRLFEVGASLFFKLKDVTAAYEPGSNLPLWWAAGEPKGPPGEGPR